MGAFEAFFIFDFISYIKSIYIIIKILSFLCLIQI